MEEGAAGGRSQVWVDVALPNRDNFDADKDSNASSMINCYIVTLQTYVHAMTALNKISNASTIASEDQQAPASSTKQPPFQTRQW
jgi:hypothetical protein